MRAMVLEAPGRPLSALDRAEPEPGPGQVLVAVEACAICRTDLHIADGELEHPALPLVLGHQAAGTIASVGDGVEGRAVGDRVGVPWLGWADGTCAFCTSGLENLCPNARFTGYDLDGGYAERLVADARFCLPIPGAFEPIEAAPLLCAGAIGYRALRLAGELGEGARLGLYGFGNAARIVTQVALDGGLQLFAFTRPGDERTQAAALELGCAWAGGSTEPPPEPLDAAILFAAVGELVPLALGAVAPGGTVVCAEIHMSDVPSFPYELLWRERVLRSVANLTRRDGEELLAAAARIPIRTQTRTFPLAEANEALEATRRGSPETVVLVP
jgi:alcohol dehydrogenase, propanol-preferring